MTKLTDEEYLNKVCKENRFTIKFKQVKTGSSKKKYVNCIVNMEDLIKWRLKYGISQQDMVTIGMMGMNLRKLQQLEENETALIGHQVMRKIRMNNLVDVEFIEEENQNA
tara:strand:+ start:794 stop:1123 length:330 start_codon:yes stop_codon:yes gene_type:complete